MGEAGDSQWMALGGQGLPEELVLEVLSHLALCHQKSRKAWDPIDHATFRSCRLVSHGVKAEVERVFPTARTYFQESLLLAYLKEPVGERAAILQTPEVALGVTEVDQIPFAFEGPARRTGEAHWQAFDAYLQACRRLSRFRCVFVVDSDPHSVASFSWRCSALRSVSLKGVTATQLQTLDLRNATVLEELDVHIRRTSPLSWVSASSVPLQLRSIDFRGSGVNVKAILDLRADERPALRELGLHNCDLVWSPEAIWSVRGAALRRLDLSSAGIDNAAVELFAFGANTTIEKLSLNANAISDPSVLQLDRNRTIRDLSLSFNSIRDPSQLRLGLNTTLRTLRIGSNPLENMDFCLEQNMSLEELVLDNAYLLSESKVPAGLAAFSKQLQHNSSLCALGLNGFGLTEENCDGLSFITTRGLAKLDLRNNYLSDDALRFLGIDSSQSLTRVLLGVDDFSDNAARFDPRHHVSKDFARNLRSATRKVELWHHGLRLV